MTARRLGERRTAFVLGPVTVEVTTDLPAVVNYLAEFYQLSRSLVDRPDWTVDARVGSGDGMRRNRYGVAFVTDPALRVSVLRADNPTDLAMTARKTVREVLIDFCERRRYVMLHASAFADQHRTIIVVGDKGSGKTTLALRSMLDHGAQYVSNDHLIVYPDNAADGALPGALVLTSLPTPLPIKVGTYLDLEHVLPEPWDIEGLDIERFRKMPPSERYRHDARVLYTYRRLGQDNPVTVALGSVHDGPSVLVVLARYAADGVPASAPVPVADPVEELLEHVRFDWMFDPVLNQRHLPRHERSRAEYAADARRLVDALAVRADVVSWSHKGHPGPLFDLLNRRSRP